MKIQTKLGALLAGLLAIVAAVSLMLASEDGINGKFALNLFFVLLSISSFFVWPILITKKGQSTDRFIFGLGYSSVSGIYFVATLLVVGISLVFSIESLGTLFALHLLLIAPLAIFIFLWNSSADKVEEIAQKRKEQRAFFDDAKLRIQGLAVNLGSRTSNQEISYLATELAEDFRFKNSRSTEQSFGAETSVMKTLDEIESELSNTTLNEKSILKGLKSIQNQLELRELALKNG